MLLIAINGMFLFLMNVLNAINGINGILMMQFPSKCNKKLK